jgi:glyoxylase-like metal-dependent hydrolase (beta-lactamase superfamily II)
MGSGIAGPPTDLIHPELPMDRTRRDLLRWTSLSLAVVWPSARLLGQAPAPAPGAQQAPPPPPKTSFADVRGSVGVFNGSGGTIGTYVGKSAVVVVDTQFPATAQICADGLKTKAGGRAVDLVIDTHFHGDHTGGNGIFKAAGAKSIVAHARVPELMKSRVKPGAPEPTYPDATFPDTWRKDLGDEVVSAKFYGPAHTGGDIVVLFEKANVVHMGDLVFNRMQPFIDRPGGASIQGWITLLEQVAKAHGDDTIFVFGHAGEKFPVTGGKADLRHMGSFLTALLEFTRKAKQAGQTREAFVKTTAPVPGFDDYGPLLERVTGAAFDEVQ